MSNITERLQIIVEEMFNGNKAQFAKAINIAPTSISNYLSEKRQSKPSCEILEKIINVVDNISPEWLLTGKGPMLRSDQTPPPAAEPVKSETGALIDRLLTKIDEKEAKIEQQAEEIGSLRKEIEGLQQELVGLVSDKGDAPGACIADAG